MHSENSLNDLDFAKQRQIASLIQKTGPISQNYFDQFRCLVKNRFWQRNTLVFLLQYTGLMFSTLASTTSFAWFASGTACGLIFLRGNTVMPGLGLGSFLAYYSAGMDMKRAGLCALVLLAQAFFLVKLCYRSSLLSLVFFEYSFFLKFVSFCALTTAGGSLLLTLLGYPDLLHPSSFSQINLSWWLANLNGTLIFASALFTWDAYVPDLLKFKKINKMKLLLVFTLLLFSVFGILKNTFFPETLFFAFLAWLVLLWISRLYGWCGVIAALLILALIFQCSLLLNFPLGCLQQSHSLLFIQLFLLGCVLSGMVLAI